MWTKRSPCQTSPRKKRSCSISSTSSTRVDRGAFNVWVSNVYRHRLSSTSHPLVLSVCGGPTESRVRGRRELNSKPRATSRMDRTQMAAGEVDRIGRLAWLRSGACNYGYDTDISAEVANSMSSAPRALTSSCWNLISAATFLRSRRKRVSMIGLWPSTAVYISVRLVSKQPFE